MTSKHTPGPWRLVKTVTRGEFCWDYKIRSEDDSAICTLGPVAQDANARLIAEAPAMLDALRDWAGLSRSPADGPLRPSQAKDLRERTRALLARIDGKE